MRPAGSRSGGGPSATRSEAGAARTGAVAAVLIAAALVAAVILLRPYAGSVPGGGGAPGGVDAPPPESVGFEATGMLGGGDTAGFARATTPRPFEFPRDHGPHPAFRTEWWYLTGNLETAAGRRFGYQFTLFRTALAPEPPEGASPWRTNQAYMTHVALTDVEDGRFLAEERFARGALGLAGARGRPFRVWLEDVSLEATGEGEQRGGDPAFPARLRADAGSARLELVLDRGKPPVARGTGGLSPKGPEPGNASHYYSLTRMPTRGRVVLDGDTLEVGGLSWMDREWSTSSLGEGMAGWDWFALQLDDGTELSYYRLRREDGTAAPESAGSWIGPDGGRRTLASGQVRLRPRAWWESPDGGARYPVAWELRVPELDLELVVEPVLRDQEWRRSFRYWEGAVDVRGSRGGAPVEGRGYLELTGYGEGAAPGGP